jgi:hypothetical protein
MTACDPKWTVDWARFNRNIGRSFPGTSDINQTLDIRDEIISQLRTLASSEEVRRYQRDVPYAQVGYELVDSWLKAPQFPGPTLEAAFDETEQEAISKFHEVFMENYPHLPDFDVERLLGSKRWHQIQVQALATLDLINQ